MYTCAVSQCIVCLQLSQDFELSQRNWKDGTYCFNIIKGSKLLVDQLIKQSRHDDDEWMQQKSPSSWFEIDKCVSLAIAKCISMIIDAAATSHEMKQQQGVPTFTRHLNGERLLLLDYCNIPIDETSFNVKSQKTPPVSCLQYFCLLRAKLKGLFNIIG